MGHIPAGKVKISLGLALASGFFLAMCTGTPTFGEDASPRLLRFGIDAADLGTGDPHRAASRNDRAVVDMIFNGLLRYKPGEAPQIEPDLAVRIPNPQTIDGRQVWRFELRRDAMCHPGPKTEAYPLTADDVVFSLKRASDPAVSAYAGDYEGMSATKVDEYTVDISFDIPLSSILLFPKVADYAGGFIVCQKAVEAMGDAEFGKHPVGTGPFMFAGHMPGERVLLNANTGYFRGRPRIDGVEVWYVSKIADRDQQLLEGELDVIFGSEQPKWFESIKSNDGIQVDVFGVGQVVAIHFNMARPPFDDPRVRKAIAYGIDRDVFRSFFAESVVENVYSPVPGAFLPGGLTRAEVERLELNYPLDLEKARALLSDAGYADEISLKLVTSERGHYLVNYESLRDQLAAIGVKIDLEVVEHREMHSRIRADENAIVIYVAWRPNADVFLTRFFHSDSDITSGKSPDTNFSHYSGIDQLILTARQTHDPTSQVRIWKQAQVKLLSDAASYPLHYVNLVYARTKQVDYGHPLKASMSLYPQFTENTRLVE